MTLQYHVLNFNIVFEKISKNDKKNKCEIESEGFFFTISEET